ncbi:uncharacterized protein O3C94_002299 [Discoglossus pictus]
MVFGAGTKLSVEPGNQRSSVPSVSVLGSHIVADHTTACVVKNFYPKEVEIYMNSTTQNTGEIKASPVHSIKGIYSAVHVEKLEGEDVRCLAKHQGQWTINDDDTSRPKAGPDDQTEMVMDIKNETCEQPRPTGQ